MKLKNDFYAFRKSTGLHLRDLAIALAGRPIETIRHLRRIAAPRARRIESVARAAEAASGLDKSGLTIGLLRETVAALGQRFGILVLHESRNKAHLGVADLDYLAAAQHVLRLAPHAKIFADGKQIKTNAPDQSGQIMQSKSIKIYFTDAANLRSEIYLEPYSPSPNGAWVSASEKNAVMRRCNAPVFDKAGLTLAQALLGGQSSDDRAAERPIDAVLTWVDHTDDAWQRSYAAARQHMGDIKTDATATTRFHNNEELRFALRSLHDYAPWIRRIYIFTNCRPPTWLDTANDKIVFVSHADVMPPEILPTFNSHVIESYLHKIPDLSEHFLYLNDDFFVMNPALPSDFFNQAGQSYARLEEYGVVSGPYGVADPDYMNAARSGAALILKELGFVPTQLHRHVPYALQKSVLSDMESLWHSDYADFRTNAFRGANDLNIPSFLYHHFAIGTGRAMWKQDQSVLIKSNDVATQAARFDRALHPDTAFVCINEGGTEDPAPQWHSQVRRFLIDNFPNTAPWET
ncbi:stealth conserved region 3 domain-containing protein [Loktanella sp. R86503]|uniref:stealth conserved region 3 domain-containing protein n=1 Tax=Loktanella sp. R86503 TaxID=3093847 RepID=UPI0036DEA0CD